MWNEAVDSCAAVTGGSGVHLGLDECGIAAISSSIAAKPEFVKDGQVQLGAVQSFVLSGRAGADLAKRLGDADAASKLAGGASISYPLLEIAASAWQCKEQLH